MRRADDRPLRPAPRELREEHERVRVNDGGDGPAGERRLEELGALGRAAEAGAQDQGVGPFQRRRRLGLEVGPERGLDREHVGEGRARGRHAPGGRDELHEPRARRERPAGRVQRRARHAVRPAHHGHAAAVALVHRGRELGEAGARPPVRDEQRPARIGRREPGVHDDHLPAPFARQQVAAARTAEGHRQLRAHRPVGLAAREVEPGGAVDRHDGRGVGDEPLRQREHVAAGGARGARAEQRIHRDRRRGPRLLAAQLVHAVEPGERPVVDRVVRLGIDGRHPDGDARRVQRACDDPAIAAVVPRPGGDEHTALHRVRALAHQHLGDGAARGVHEHARGDAELRARRRVPGGGFGGREHRNRVHGITTPP